MVGAGGRIISVHAMLVVVVLFLLVAVGTSQPTRSEAGSFGVATVNSTNDVNDGVCNATHCSLREAINFINGSPFNNTVGFNIASCPPACTITPLTPLPPVTRTSSSINGRLEPDYAGQPLVVIDGSAQGFASGLRLLGTSATILGLQVKNATLAGIAAEGEELLVEDSLFTGNGVGGIASNFGSTAQTTVRNTTVSGNGSDGIGASGASLVVSDSVVIGNDDVGINTGFGGGIGSVTIENTTMSGNGSDGFRGSGGQLTVSDSLIRENDGAGLSTSVGGGFETADVHDNDISENGSIGLVTDTPGATIRDNTIINNGGQGINAGGLIADNVVIGNGHAETGNNASGIVLDLGAVATGNTVTNNAGPGILPLSNAVIGGTDPADANTISGNGGPGVFLPSFLTSTGVRMLGNSIHSNEQLGIDLQEEGDQPGVVSPNDPGDVDDGVNHLQNFPVLEAAFAGSLHVGGTIDSIPNTDFRLEFFLNDSCDPSGNGEGQQFVGFANVPTPDAGTATFAVDFDVNAALGKQVTATATNLATNDTSEFSRCAEVTVAPTPTPTIPASPTATPGPTFLLGDANCDGTVDEGDIIASLSEFGGLPPGACGDPADADCDGDIDADDALRIALYLAGVPRPQPSGCPEIGTVV